MAHFILKMRNKESSKKMESRLKMCAAAMAGPENECLF